MNKLDKDYTALLQDILDNGVTKETRNGGTISVFGRQIRHQMSDGFPLLTTKKMYFKGIVTELLWFLQGRTDLRYLLENDCHIWTGDAYKVYDKDFDREHPPFSAPYPKRLTQKEFEEKIMTDDEFNGMYGNLGSIYGKQWRSWTKKKMYLSTDGSYENIYDEADQTVIDQIANLINDLKTTPDSRRLMVSAWNVGELDQMVLPPCHYGFEVYTRELKKLERINIAIEKKLTHETAHLTKDFDYQKWCDEQNIPTRAISLMWSQRSCDFPLGIPYNIASYGLLLTILGKMVNMVPDELIGNLGNTHIYLNQIDGVKEQIGRAMTTEERMDWWFKNCKPNKEVYDSVDEMPDYGKHTIFDLCLPRTPTRTREPYPLPTLKINSGNENWHLLELDEVLNTLDPDITFKVENYQSHPTIKFPLSN
jgi:thymidylate synthase